MEEAMDSRSNPGSSDATAVRVKRKTLQAVLEQCQRALELLGNGEGGVDADDDGDDPDDDGAEPSRRDSASTCRDREADELCELLKSRVECPEFLEKLECAKVSVPQNAEEGSSWDMVDENDLWETENADLDKEDYVLVRQEDIVEGIACFMAAYLSSLKQTKDLSEPSTSEGCLKCLLDILSCYIKASLICMICLKRSLISSFHACPANAV
ncbi:uncharacterized protein LOC115675808 isoform X3 [Syzygium oleosum]|uniref:uncharacterized protein LOC115675808 isoform X3 n=1 Tax=Syzygium oleosum TaxID=219896 RepID=UPI0024B95C86|nr:uncharacterized protein LOC115675808 isoform X3 [Syzygium oleosum]